MIEVNCGGKFLGAYTREKISGQMISTILIWALGVLPGVLSKFFDSAAQNQPVNGKSDDAGGTVDKRTGHKEKPANPVVSRVYELSRCGAGGGGRTRTGY